MKLGFGPKYFSKCVLTDSVNNSILKKIAFGLNGPDRVTYVHQVIVTCFQNQERNKMTFVLYSL